MSKTRQLELLLAVFLAAACADRPTGPDSVGALPGRLAASLVTDPATSLTVTGFTYGPNFEEATVSGCINGGSRTNTYWDSTVFTAPDGYRWVLLHATTQQASCPIGDYDPGGEPMYGGDVQVDGYAAGQWKVLGHTDISWGMTADFTNFPNSGMFSLTATPAYGCTFLDWVFGNDYGTKRYENPLVVYATEVSRVQAEVQCSFTHNPGT